MITLLILTACGNENQIIDTNPPSVRVEEAEVTEECAPSEQPVINLTCPEPVVHLSCPEPVVNVQVAAPDVQVDVAAPDVDVTVEGPDMSGIEAAIDDMIDALANNSGGTSGDKEWMFFASELTVAAGDVAAATNTRTTDLIITEIRLSNTIDCWIEGSAVVIAEVGHGTGAPTNHQSGSNQLSLPVHQGETLYCATNEGGAGYVFINGYYQ